MRWILVISTSQRTLPWSVQMRATSSCASVIRSAGAKRLARLRRIPKARLRRSLAATELSVHDHTPSMSSLMTTRSPAAATPVAKAVVAAAQVSGAAEALMGVAAVMPVAEVEELGAEAEVAVTVAVVQVAEAKVAAVVAAVPRGHPTQCLWQGRGRGPVIRVHHHPPVARSQRRVNMSELLTPRLRQSDHRQSGRGTEAHTTLSMWAVYLRCVNMYK